jgi:hypothetical protein
MTETTDSASPFSSAAGMMVRYFFAALSGLSVFVGLGWWAMTGARLGWSMNRVPVAQIDEITGIEYVTYDDRFVPGVEIAGGFLLLSLVFLAFALFPFGKSKSSSS